MNTHPIKLREKSLRLLYKGYTKTAVMELLDISYDSLKRCENLRQETGSLKDNHPRMLGRAVGTAKKCGR